MIVVQGVVITTVKVTVKLVTITDASTKVRYGNIIYFTGNTEHYKIHIV